MCLPLRLDRQLVQALLRGRHCRPDRARNLLQLVLRSLRLAEQLCDDWVLDGDRGRERQDAIPQILFATATQRLQSLDVTHVVAAMIEHAE